MNFSDLAKKRRSTKAFLPNHPFSDEDFKQILEVVSLSPSGYNVQPWEFVLIRDPKRLEKLQSIAFDQEKVGQASAVVIVTGDTFMGRNVEKVLDDWIEYGYCTEDDRQKYRNSIAKNRAPEKLKDMALRNSSLAAMTFMYAAEELGWNTCPMMGFQHSELGPFISLPEDRIITMMIAIGKSDPGKEKPRLPRKSLDAIMHHEKYPENH